LLFSQLTVTSSEPGTFLSQTIDGFLNLLLFRRTQTYFCVELQPKMGTLPIIWMTDE